MRQKKIIAIFLSTLLTVAFFPTIEAAAQAEIIIDITDEDGGAAEMLEIGDIIRVTVSFANFSAPGIMSAHPSLHFNPRVVQVVHPTTHAPLPQPWLANNASFFRRGPEIAGEPSPTAWGVSSAGAFPFLNNTNGLIGMWIDSPGHAPAPIDGIQTMYSVYMRVIGFGSTDIRLSRRADGPAQGGAMNWLHDPMIYTEGGLQSYGHPLPATGIRIVSPDAPFVYSMVEIVRYTDGLRITHFEQLSNEDEIFVRLERTDVPDTARLFLAVFDNGKFIESVNTNGSQTENIRLPEDIQNVTIKVFVWESLGMMNPIFYPLILPN